MVSDLQLFVESCIELAEYSPKHKVAILAQRYNLSVDSVRGRISRASGTPAARAAITRHLATQAAAVPPSVKRQNEILKWSEDVWNDFTQVNAPRRGVFLSDMHLPYTRWDAYELMLTVSDWFRPHVISALNDALDNKGYSDHKDDDPVWKTLWRSDIQNALNTLSSVHFDLNQTLAEGGVLAAVAGNHDNWLFRYWRAHDKQTAERNIANFLEGLKSDNVLTFNRNSRQEPALHLSPGLVWVHGMFMSSNPILNARKAFAHFMEPGKPAKSVVQGHTHRAASIDGILAGYTGVKFINNGHLRNTKVDWQKHDMRDWRMSITLCTFNPQEWEHTAELVLFEERKDKLIARYEGNEWSVKLDKRMPYFT